MLSIRSILALPLEFARCIGGKSGVPAEGKNAWLCAARWCGAVSVQWLDPVKNESIMIMMMMMMMRSVSEKMQMPMFREKMERYANTMINQWI